jgi:cell division ATPase FtsA
MTDAGLDVLGACPKGVAAYWCYRECGRLRPDETVVLVNIGHENTDVAIVRKGTLLFARNVAGGGKLLTDAIQQNVRVDFATAEKLKVSIGNLTPRGQAKYRDSREEKVANAMMQAGGHFVSAVNSSVMFAKAQTKVPECQVSRVVLMGGGSRLKGLPEYLESNLNLPVEVFDPMDSVDLAALSEEAQAALKQDQGGMAVALGLAQMAADEDAFRVAVLPEADRRRRRFKERTVFSIAAAAVAVASIAVAWSLRGGASGTAEAEKAKLLKLKETFESNRREFEKSRDRVNVVTGQKVDLRTIVALGPAFEIVTHAVQDVVSAGEGYPEIFFPRISAKVVDHQVQDAQGNSVALLVPAVEFEGFIEEKGRPISQVEAKFKLELRSRLNAIGGLEYVDVGALGADGKFKFRVRQLAFPEKVAAERGP